MQLKIIFLFVAIAAVGAKEKQCGEERSVKCVLNLLTIGLQERSIEEVCAALSEATDCMNEAAEECTGGKGNLEIDEGRQALRSLISQNCPERELEIPVDIVKCISGLEEEMMECVSDGVSAVLERIMKLPGEVKLNENEIKCSMYQFVTKCVFQKVEDSCGKEAGQLALEEIFDAPEEIQESCIYAGIKGAIRRLADDIVKRRK